MKLWEALKYTIETGNEVCCHGGLIIGYDKRSKSIFRVRENEDGNKFIDYGEFLPDQVIWEIYKEDKSNDFKTKSWDDYIEERGYPLTKEDLDDIKKEIEELKELRNKFDMK